MLKKFIGISLILVILIVGLFYIFQYINLTPTTQSNDIELFSTVEPYEEDDYYSYLVTIEFTREIDDKSSHFVYPLIEGLHGINVIDESGYYSPSSVGTSPKAEGKLRSEYPIEDKNDLIGFGLPTEKGNYKLKFLLTTSENFEGLKDGELYYIHVEEKLGRNFSWIKKQPIKAVNEIEDSKAADKIEIDDVMGEKTVISEEIFIGGDQKEYTAILSQGEDGTAYLSVSDSQINIKSADVTLQQESHTMNIVNSMIAVSTNFMTATGYYVDFSFFTYEDQKLQKVFSNNDMSCKINGFQMDPGEVTIEFPYANTLLTYSLTNTERERSEEVISELRENEIELNGEFIKEIADNIVCSPIEIEIVDVNQDGRDVVLVLTNISTVGTKTPIRINTNAVFLFEIEDEILSFNRVDFVNNQMNKNDLFSYFPDTLVNEK